MFAGSGTVGVESFISGRNSILIDINPLLPELMELKLFRTPIDEDKLISEAKDIITPGASEFQPDWKNLNYWYREPILEILKKYWGKFYNNDYTYSLILKYALLYISRKFSNADDSIPKLFSSKRKKSHIEKLLKSETWKEKLKTSFLERVIYIARCIGEFQKLAPTDPTPYYKAIVGDSYKLDLNKSEIPEKIDLIITSPPYLQAQEYIRSIKLDLYWSGYNDAYIRKLSRTEIPYRKCEGGLSSPIIEKLKEHIKYSSLSKTGKRIFDSYFYYTLKTLEKYSGLLKKGGKLCVFVGSPKIEGTEVNIWEVIMEYFLDTGEFRVIDVIADPIVSKKIPLNRRNANPNGMSYEYFVILEKERAL